VTPRFSVCIPNFNYGRYLGETIQSVLDQGRPDVEVCVSDNASTDDSVSVVRSFAHAGVILGENPRNLGFSPNLDRAVGLSSAPTALTLSSDDLMLPGALEVYAALLDDVGTDGTLVGSAVSVIDADGAAIGSLGAQPGVWRLDHRDARLSRIIGHDVYGAPPGELLASSVRRMRNPYHFAAVAFPRSLWQVVGGYGGQRLYNPDRWFNWRLLGVAERAYFIDAELFAYRWHSSNQEAQQQKTRALKYLVDEYTSTLQLDEATLRGIGLERSEVVQAFLTNDIALRGLRDIAAGRRSEALRALRFAQATYPWAIGQNGAVWLLRAAVAAGPAAPPIGRLAFDTVLERWRRRQGASAARLHRTWSHREVAHGG